VTDPATTSQDYRPLRWPDLSALSISRQPRIVHETSTLTPGDSDDL